MRAVSIDANHLELVRPILLVHRIRVAGAGPTRPRPDQIDAAGVRV